jgi:hypothetical protein
MNPVDLGHQPRILAARLLRARVGHASFPLVETPIAADRPAGGGLPAYKSGTADYGFEFLCSSANRRSARFARKTRPSSPGTSVAP